MVSAEPGPTDPVDPDLLDQLDGRIRLERIHHLRPKIESLLRALLRRLLQPLVRRACPRWNHRRGPKSAAASASESRRTSIGR